MARRHDSLTARRGRLLLAVVAAVALAVLPVTGAAAEVAVDARASTTTAGAVRIEWAAVPDSIGYLVVVQRRAGDAWVAVPDRQFRVTSVRPILIDGLTNGETYRACVAAVRSDGYLVGLSAGAVPFGLPGAPTITEVTAVEAGLTVEWTPAAPNGRPITAYTITVTPADVEEVIVGGAATSVTIEDLNPDVSYTVSVRATNLRGQGEPGESASAVQPLAIAYRPTGPVVDHASIVAPSLDGLVRIVSSGPCAAPVAAAPPGGDATLPEGSPEEGGAAAGPEAGVAPSAPVPDVRTGPASPGRVPPAGSDGPTVEEGPAVVPDETPVPPRTQEPDRPSGTGEDAAAPSAPDGAASSGSRRTSTFVVVMLVLLIAGVGGLATMRREVDAGERSARRSD